MSDYRNTVFLPKTSLPTRARPQDEEKWVSAWEGLYDEIRNLRASAQPFVLHDGPPYANGDIHVGHALNKVLKDITVRGRSMLGQDAAFVPGWDCHGLPIEWKVEEQWRKDKKDKAAAPRSFRRDCRAFAQKWVDTQREQFRRLGVLANWQNPYLTMSPEAEDTILAAFHAMVEKGLVYRANKPVLWSPLERTALAEAEVTDREHLTTSVWLKFVPLTGPLNDEGASLLVWTTTPWSLPGNVAVAYNPRIAYGLYQTKGGKYVVADALASQTFDEEYTRLRDVPVSDFNMADGTTGRACYNPLGSDYTRSRIIPGDFVRETAGTGFVHVGPAHSTEDWIAWRNYAGADATFPNPIMDNGVYDDTVPLFAGVSVTKGKKLGPANELIIEHLSTQGALYRQEDRPLTMQHSWRSEAVLITRATPQVFINLENAIRPAIDELEFVEFEPPQAKQRMVSMMESRPDWLVSRQRLWGTPLALFVHRETGAICTDTKVLSEIQKIITSGGTELWWTIETEPLFASVGRTDGAEYDRLDDVLDVWFDSGCVHALMGNQADIVIEGTDQSRGWYQSSLLVSVLSGRSAPYRKVVTHGFVLDAAGRKMSKSEGNVLDPQKVVEQHGADALRVWVASTDVTEDLRISMPTMATHAETARKIRNTLRYLVGALHDVTTSEQITLTGQVLVREMQHMLHQADGQRLPELERYIMHRLVVTNAALSGMLMRNDLTRYMATISNFCVNDLSSLYFDIRKDALYCDEQDSWTRRSCLFVISELFEHMVRWVAPVMTFAAEDVWRTRHPDSSIHTQTWRKWEEFDWVDDALAERWGRLLEFRSQALKEIEALRGACTIKSAAEVRLHAYVRQGSQAEFDLQGDLAELTLTSEVTVTPMSTDIWPHGDQYAVVSAEKTPHDRCDRCWRHVEAISSEKLCGRCEEVVKG